MQIALINSTKSSRLILIFAGWGMDCHPFEGLAHHGYDIAIAFDHRKSECHDAAILSNYDEICILAWSFGVPAANAFLRDNPSLPITARIAVNGTLHPVDDLMGIPQNIFEGTLNNLSAATISKFRRRMCGSSENFAKFMASAPRRSDLKELADELQAIRQLPPAKSDDRHRWDTVYIYDSDRIIPTENQLRAWHGHRHVITLSGAHLPDFTALLRRSLVDKPLIAERFCNASRSYDYAADAQRTIARRLADIISENIAANESPDTLEIGCGTGMLTTFLTERLIPSSLTLWDLTPIAKELPGVHRLCDAETAIRTIKPNSLDLITSASTIQWFNSPAEFIRNCRRALRTDGLLALSTFGSDNFAELKPFISSSLCYYDLSTWREILHAAGFEPITLIEEHLQMQFEDTAALLRHIRQTGVNALPAGPTRASTTRTLLTSGPKTITYHPLYIVARPVHI